MPDALIFLPLPLRFVMCWVAQRAPMAHAPTPGCLLRTLRRALQGAIIIVGVLQLFDFAEWLYLWKVCIF